MQLKDFTKKEKTFSRSEKFIDKRKIFQYNIIEVVKV